MLNAALVEFLAIRNKAQIAVTRCETISDKTSRERNWGELSWAFVGVVTMCCLS